MDSLDSPTTDIPSTIDPPPLPLSPYTPRLRLFTAVTFFLAALGILYLVGDYYWYKIHHSASLPMPVSVQSVSTETGYSQFEPDTTVTLVPSLSVTSSVSPTPVVPLPLEMVFEEPKKLDWQFNLASAKNEVSFSKDTFRDLVDVGHITTLGHYQNFRVITLLYDVNTYQGKGPGSYEAPVSYVLMSGHQIIFPTQLHSLWSDELDSFSAPSPILSDPTYTIQIDRSIQIPQLVFPQEISGNNPRQKLSFMRRVRGTRNDALVEKIATLPGIGDIFTTRPSQSISDTFLPDTIIEPSQGSKKRVLPENCSGDDCLKMNGFYVFFPDGTFGMYRYSPDLVIHKPSEYPDQAVSYQSKTQYGCSVDYATDMSNVAPEFFKPEQLEIAFTDPQTSEPLYRLKDTHDPQLEIMYERYKKATTYAQQYQAELTVASYDLFISHNPILFWTDPWGRQLRLINQNYTEPQLCEPIIYLYPVQTENVQVKLLSLIHLSYSEPHYEKSWQMVAHPDGTLFDVFGKKYPYLFWEGTVGMFSLPHEGTVVKREQIEPFLNDSLLRLGLNEKESVDFKDAWLPKLVHAPYYQIYFWNQTDIDRLAPLKITPKPDTIIRVLMDYRALSSEVMITPQTWPELPLRSGFTVVEWGGVRR